MESQGTKGVYGANGTKGPAGYLWRKYLDIAELERAAISNHETSDLNCGLMSFSRGLSNRGRSNIEMADGNLELATERTSI